jgi:hypothetical protein
LFAPSGEVNSEETSRYHVSRRVWGRVRAQGWAAILQFT